MRGDVDAVRGDERGATDAAGDDTQDLADGPTGATGEREHRSEAGIGLRVERGSGTVVVRPVQLPTRSEVDVHVARLVVLVRVGELGAGDPGVRVVLPVGDPCGVDPGSGGSVSAGAGAREYQHRVIHRLRHLEVVATHVADVVDTAGSEFRRESPA